MVDDRRLTISTSARLHPDEIARHTFATGRRGFEPSEVRAFLEQVGREMLAAEEREQALRELLVETERRAENPVLDEATLTTALGQETARVLRSAHEAAAELVARAEADASRTVTEAQEEAGNLQARAEQNAADRASQSEAVAAETRRRAQEEAAVRLDAAHAEADALTEQARVECRAMLAEAQELRSRVLGDLTRRRRVLHSQIEQLRAGRERLAETISDVRHRVDRITDDLFRAEDEARMAAEVAGRQLAAREGHPGPTATDAEIDARAASGETGVASDGEDVGVHEPGSGEIPVVPEGARGEPTSLLGVAPEEIGVVIEDDGQGPRREQTVEELFARLRAEQGNASHDRGEEPGRAAPAGPTPVDGKPSAAVATDEAVSGVGPDRVAEAVSEGREIGGRPVETDHTDDSVDADGAEDTARAEDTDGTEETDGADPLLARRDEVLTPIVATLARRLKRALTDDQNDILDRLRASKGWGPEVLPTGTEHLERYARAGTEQLAEVAGAGSIFAGGKADEAPNVDDLAAELAAAIVLPLRRRLEGEESSLETDDDAYLVEHVGAAFRDWKGARIERLAADEAVAAFSRAALAVTDPEKSLRWVVDDDGAECPDCDDNALAGLVPRGEAFPTGHPHPPAHAGCRCLLAPADA